MSASNVMVVEYEFKSNPEKAFKMQVPADWNVEENKYGYELWMEPKEKPVATEENPIATNPNISVKVLNRELFIDDRSLGEYENEIVNNFRTFNGESSQFQIFQRIIQPISDSHQALLYDAIYKRDNDDILQTILVTSDSTKLFRVTLTDYKPFFEHNSEVYYPILASIQLDSLSPIRPGVLQQLEPIGIGIGVILVFLVIFKIFAKSFQNRSVGEYLSGSNYDEGSPESLYQPISSDLDEPVIKRNNQPTTFSAVSGFGYQNSETEKENPAKNEKSMPGFSEFQLEQSQFEDDDKTKQSKV